MLKKILREEFDKLVNTKIFKDKWDAFITWDTLDMFNLANTEKEAKDNLFRRINTGWQDPIYENQEHD